MDKSRLEHFFWRWLAVSSVLIACLSIFALLLFGWTLTGRHEVLQQPISIHQRSLLASIGPQNPGRRQWTIAIGHDYAAHEYINEQGYLAGFGFDLIRAVCSAAGVTCLTIWDDYKNCLIAQPGPHTMGGVGLLGYYYDTCTAWSTTVARLQIYKFSKPYLKNEVAQFYVRKGRGSFKFQNSSVIGFMNGWSSDPRCLARNRYYVSPQNIRNFNFTDDLADAISKGGVDAGFGARADLEPYLDKVEPYTEETFECQLAGNGMMMRKDSRFDEPFNKGLNQIISTGEFGKICQLANKDPSEGGHGHKGSIDCIST